MTQDAESGQLLEQIDKIWGSDIRAFRYALMAKTRQIHTRQAVYRWRHTGVPKRYRRTIHKLIQERAE